MLVVRGCYQELNLFRQHVSEELEDIKDMIELMDRKQDENSGSDDGRFLHVEANTKAIKANQILIAGLIAATLANFFLQTLS